MLGFPQDQESLSTKNNQSWEGKPVTSACFLDEAKDLEGWEIWWEFPLQNLSSSIWMWIKKKMPPHSFYNSILQFSSCETLLYAWTFEFGLLGLLIVFFGPLFLGGFS